MKFSLTSECSISMLFYRSRGNAGFMTRVAYEYNTHHLLFFRQINVRSVIVSKNKIASIRILGTHRMARQRYIGLVFLVIVGLAIFSAPVMAANVTGNNPDADPFGGMVESALGTLLEQKGPVLKTLQQTAAAVKTIDTIEQGAKDIPLIGPELSNGIKSFRQWFMSGAIPQGGPAKGPVAGSGAPAAGSGSSSGTVGSSPIAGSPGGSGQGAMPGTGSPGSGSSPSPNPSPLTTPSSQGSIGGGCWDDNTCFQGDCVNDRCVPCGRWGQRACTQSTPACEQVSTIVGGFCRISSAECGQSGNPPCTKDRDEPFCYSGVYNAAAGICEDCGDYRQPCCRSTGNPCDYGVCTGGICDKTESTGGVGSTGTGTAVGTGSGSVAGGGIAGSLCTSPAFKLLSTLLMNDADAVNNGAVDPDHCYQTVAANLGDLSLCDTIKRGAPMTKCYLLIAERKGDSSICQQIPSTSDIQGYLPIDCLWAVAMKTKDPAVCKEMGEKSIGRMGIGEMSQKTCLSQIAGGGNI